MNAIIARLSDEPVAVGAFVQSVLLLLVAFGVPLTDEQRTAILGLVAATITIAAVVRQKVTPVP